MFLFITKSHVVSAFVDIIVVFIVVVKVLLFEKSFFLVRVDVDWAVLVLR